MKPTVKIVSPSGILDGTKAGPFRLEIDQCVSEGPAIVLIDLKNVTFMDSSGLGALVLALRTVRAADGKLFICSVNEQIRMLFELTSMDRVFEIFKDEAEFQKHFSP